MGVLFLQLTKEATYVFKYDEQVVEVDVFVDNVENRRYIDDRPFNSNSYLNYKGTGNPYQKINAELVSETILENDPNDEKARLMYFLPDVTAYAIGGLSMVTDENGETYKDLYIRLLNKVQ